MSEITKDELAYLKDTLQGWPDAMCLTSKDIADLISLIESSGEKESGPGDTQDMVEGPLGEFRPRCSPSKLLEEEFEKRYGKPAPSPGPFVEDSGDICCHDDIDAAFPAPLPKEADVQKSIHLSTSVEEAMEIIATELSPRPLEQKALAVIRAAIAKGVEAERRYAELVEDVSRRTDQARTMEVKK